MSEVSNLRAGDIRISPRNGSRRVHGGKGEKFRTVPLNVDARKAVQTYLEELGETEGDRWLFMGKRGEWLKSSEIQYLVQRYAYDARLEEVTPHTLRHTFGKNLVDAGVPLDRAASLLRHESVDTTRIYDTPSAQTFSGRWRRWRWSRETKEVAEPQFDSQQITAAEELIASQIPVPFSLAEPRN